MTEWIYDLPTKIIFGGGCINEITEVLRSYDSKKILLVTGMRSSKESGLTAKIGHFCSQDIIIYNSTQNPHTEVVENGIRILREEKCDLVIALGGGSVIDAAKAISVLGKNPGGVRDYFTKRKNIEQRGFPLIAIPTIAGSGSEVTPYASIIIEGKKISLTSEYIFPNVAIIDPELTLTTPKLITASAGLDSLTHCIEAYWSKRHTPISDLFALEGAKLIFLNIINAINYPKDILFREKMSLGSIFSGFAIGISRTTIVHSVSYPLTVHFGIPHGLACSLTLPAFINFNYPYAKDRIERIGREIGIITPWQLAERLENLINQLGLPTKLRDFGIKEKDIDIIIQEGFRLDRAENNPRIVSKDDLKNILLKIL